jgi:hydrophobic/amphiphilic exporter-1 (mainly G- bacteria), HAE1 family
VADAFASQNVDLPTGSLYGKERLYTVKAKGMLTDAKSYNRQIVAFRGGQPVRLEDIGQAVDSVLYDKNIAYLGQDQSILMAVRRQPGTNTIAVVDAIKKIMPEIHQTLPPAVSLRIMFDASDSIRESVQDVKFSLLLAIGLVVIVVFLFLKNVTATVVASLALPTALLGTLPVMLQMKFSLDNLSLMALTLAVGFVVDDAIVMIENVVSHMERGKTVMQASLDGARQIGFTIISMTLSLAVVFIPIMFMAGIIGRILNEMAVTVTICILVSGFVTLTFTPMLCSRFLKAGKTVGQSGRLFRTMENGYKKSLRFALDHRRATMAASGAILVLTLWLFTKVPAGFIPASDQGFFYGFAVAEQSASFDTMKRRMLEVSRVIMDNPNIREMIGIVGVGGPISSMNNLAFFPLSKPVHERKATAEGIIGQLVPKLAEIPDLQVFMFNPPSIQIGGKQARSLYQYTLLSPDPDALYAAAVKMEAAMRARPELAGVNSDMQIQGPQMVIHIDRDKATTIGVSAQAIETALQSAYAARQISNIYATTDTYKVVVEVEPRFQTDPALLNKLYVQPDLDANKDKNKDDLVPLSSLVTITPGLGPITVNHTGQLTSVTIAFNTAPGYSLSQAMDAIREAGKGVLPDNVSSMYEGLATAFRESFESVPFLLFLAVMVIYIILGILYESFIHPLTILSGLPSAALGGLLTLLVFNRPIDIYGFVGIIMLIGIVKKNAIMVVDFAIEEEKNGNEPKEAVFLGCIERFRPIMMTTVAAIAGIMPIAVGYGAGGDARQPLGLVVAGGLIISQVVTLYLTPVFYTYMDELQTWLTKRRGSAPDPGGKG